VVLKQWEATFQQLAVSSESVESADSNDGHEDEADGEDEEEEEEGEGEVTAPVEGSPNLGDLPMSPPRQEGEEEENEELDRGFAEMGELSSFEELPDLPDISLALPTPKRPLESATEGDAPPETPVAQQRDKRPAMAGKLPHSSAAFFEEAAAGAMPALPQSLPVPQPLPQPLALDALFNSMALNAAKGEPLPPMPPATPGLQISHQVAAQCPALFDFVMTAVQLNDVNTRLAKEEGLLNARLTNLMAEAHFKLFQ
jgi:hypothetical protein